MRECWINVHVNREGDWSYCGVRWPSRLEAGRASNVAPGFFGYRLHVRLKPSSLDGLEDLATQMTTSPDPCQRARGHTRLQMIEAARAKGVR